MHDYTVSISVLKCHIFCLVLLFVSANAVPSVEFYFYDPYGTNGLVFVGDEGSLFCEAKDISDPVFTLTFNGSQIFDGENVATEYVDRIQVEEAGTCLHINLTIADASLKGEYSCGVTSTSSSVTLTDTFRLQVFESPHCRDKGSRRFTQNSTDMIRLECIHLKNQTAKLTIFSRLAFQHIDASDGVVKSITFENNKVIEQFSVNSASDELLNLTCKIGILHVKSCNINITALLLTSQSDSMPKLTKVKSSTCKSNVSFGVITKDTTTQTDENLISSSSSSVAPIPKKPANLLVIVLIPILILVIIVMSMLHLAFLIRRHNMSKDRIERVAVNHASGGSVSKMVHSSTQTDLVPMSNSKADSRTSHSYDNVDELPRVPYDGEFNTAENRYPAASNLSSDKSYYSSTLYYEW
ncbi:hypothetical protein BSL78_16146 [Apostichopus japonicus]|uniref:Ig-like domain-containing protein n=1 Tax=Stichopus japonicus TaxID=307972 RepID=A0A2G8KG89_STIJA|nr:hypothetical protein BSL78_16146 [Apostichopus japonicus]